jgi:hypothetical protein
VREALLRHWELKILALAFSSAIWFFVLTTERAETIWSAAVDVQGLPDGLVLSGDLPQRVDVQLHGLRGAIGRLSVDQVRARVDLTDARPGEMLLKLEPEHVRAPPGITVLRVMPSRIRVVVAAVPGAPPQGQPRSEAPRS